uniref:Uncharacterized protein n=1 Tax=Helianthus annuus TaxID=4232 RepID=A0A251VIZ2_HELAN
MNKVWDTCPLIVQPKVVFGGKMWETLTFFFRIPRLFTKPGFYTQLYKQSKNPNPSPFFFLKP